MPQSRRELPSRLLVGYANWGECDEKVEHAAANGVNVIIWFALSMVLKPNTTRDPMISGGPNVSCVAKVAAALEARNLPTHHFISIGGWGAPHPSPEVTAADWWSALAKFDAEAEAAGLLGGFDGFDWDLEGADSRSSPSNTFGPELLKLVADVSVRARAAGKLLSLAPPQSYLDATTSAFSYSVLEPARCWHAGTNGSRFRYAGRNTYAPLLALAPPGTYAFVSLQLYESYSIADCALTQGTQGVAQGGTGHRMGQGSRGTRDAVPLPAYLAHLVKSMASGWTVDFDSRLGLGARNVSVGGAGRDSPKLVLGLANGWSAPGRRALFLEPERLKAAWEETEPTLRPSGYMFWDIGDEGKVVAPRGPLFLARELNEFLQTRASPGGATR